MNRILIVLGLVLIASLAPACKSSKKDGSKGKTESGNPETVVEKPEENRVKYVVTGTVMLRRPYCGGAAPSEEIRKNLATPQPAQAILLTVRKGNENSPGGTVEAEVETDETGRYRMELPDGNYCLALQEKDQKLDAKVLEGRKLAFDAVCFQEWSKRCDLQFEVKGGQLELPPLILQARCFNPYLSPCVRYNGPMPQ